jgi:hypothetical protein
VKRLLPLLFLTLSLSAQPAFDDTYERFLLPVYLPTVTGPFGSEFHSQLTLRNRSTTDTYHVYGIEAWCGANILCPEPDPNVPVEIVPYGQGSPYDDGPVLIPNGMPGRFMYVPQAEAELVAMTLRAFDSSRSNTNYGTQLPTPRTRDFTRGRVVLPDVPMGSAFRKTLRIYSTRETAVMISFEGPEIIGSPPIGPPPPAFANLRPGLNVFDPAYAEFADFPLHGTNVSVVVEALECICSPPIPTPPIWAFITVTNNETQHITTIAPN